ncbi:MAG: ATP-binding cassette domain-containing protein [Saprospirales bacterium]|nr:ATP-binding cassette domain-containing protein [Saprospirales bacterium]
MVQDLSLDLKPGECSILGRSGSGKTTLLKIIAGLEGADRVGVAGQPAVDPVPAHARNVVYLYQEALLFLI